MAPRRGGEPPRAGGEPPRAVAADHRAARVMRVVIAVLVGVQGDGARDAKPRTAPRRGGARGTSRPTATGHEGVARQRGTAREVRTGECAGCQATHRGGEPPRAVARGMPSHALRWRAAMGDDITTYRNGTATWDAGQGCGRNVR